MAHHRQLYNISRRLLRPLRRYTRMFCALGVTAVAAIASAVWRCDRVAVVVVVTGGGLSLHLDGCIMTHTRGREKSRSKNSASANIQFIPSLCECEPGCVCARNVCIQPSQGCFCTVYIHVCVCGTGCFLRRRYILLCAIEA